MEARKLGKTTAEVPVLGMGTWLFVGNLPDNHVDHGAIESLRTGVDLGMTLIDTAESYSFGHAEEVIGTAIKGMREKVFIATKVSPENFSYRDVMKAVRGSLRRLKTDYIDLYQLHRPNPYVPLEETMRAMEDLVEQGAVRYIGVSNFSVDLTKKAQAALSKNHVVANQVSYSLLDREIEDKLLPTAVRDRITIIAYSPLAHGRLIDGGTGKTVLEDMAGKYGKTPVQVALNWLIVKDDVIAIPKAFQINHLREDAAATGWRMAPEDYASLNEVFSKVTPGW